MALQVSMREVVKAFGPVRVLHGVSVDLEPGRVVGLLGENGAGKTTLMKILAGYEPMNGGELLVDGARGTKAAARKLTPRPRWPISWLDRVAFKRRRWMSKRT